MPSLKHPCPAISFLGDKLAESRICFYDFNLADSSNVVAALVMPYSFVGPFSSMLGQALLCCSSSRMSNCQII
jgi:hypothetical protein